MFRLVAIVLILFLPVEASAQEPDLDLPRLQWNEDWREVGIPGFVIGPALFASAIGIRWFGDASPPRWAGDPEIDRYALRWRAPRPVGRRVAGILSWVGFAWLQVHPVLVDALLVGRVQADSGPVASRMVAVQQLAYASSAFAVTAIKQIVRRVRPDAARCQDSPGEIWRDFCERDPHRSFPSGHTAGAFTGAALICTMRANFPLYGSRAADAVACASAVGLASLVGILRLVAGRHHLVDVLAGAGVGVLTGWLVPAIAAFGFGPDRNQGRAPMGP